MSVRVLALVGCVAGIAACGSPHNPTTSAGSAHRGQFLAFSECMRAHGVTSFPDPGPRGGIQLSANSGINPFSPAFKTAQSSCRKLLPGGGPGAHPPSEQDKQAMLRISECMRRHGVTDFPDPTLTPPSSPAGYSIVSDHNGVVLAVPSAINPASPVFKHASAACGFG
jgi:hypothetical protein